MQLLYYYRVNGRILNKADFNISFTHVLIANKDENVHRFALRAIRGKVLERERKKREREKSTQFEGGGMRGKVE